MSSPLFSFILVNWNTKDLVLQCIRSIVDDCGTMSYEIIVTDNASADGSADAIEAAFPQVKVIRSTQNLGFAKGNNVAIEQCCGQYVVLVNTDVKIISGCMKILLEYMENNPNTGMVVPQVLNADGTIQISVRKEVTLLRTLFRVLWIDSVFTSLREYSHKKMESVDTAAGCFFMIQRDALEQVGLLDTDYFFYAEDRDYCKRLWDKKWRIVFYPKAQIYHYSGSSSKGKQVKYDLLMEVAGLQYWKKHHPRSFILFRILRIAFNCRRFISNFLVYILKKMMKQNNFYSNRSQGNIWAIKLLMNNVKAVPEEYSNLIEKQCGKLFAGIKKPQIVETK